jgi:hypothetical protein
MTLESFDEECSDKVRNTETNGLSVLELLNVPICYLRCHYSKDISLNDRIHMADIPDRTPC